VPLERHIERELLDELPSGDPQAMKARRDLRLINRLMWQAQTMRRLLLRHTPAPRPRSLLDLGCGDGTFLLSVARGLAPAWPALEVILLDRANIVASSTRCGFERLGWNVAIAAQDAAEFMAQDRSVGADVVVTNLFLHHFPDQAITEMFAAIGRRSRLFVACEPRRSARALWASRLLWAIGCNSVTRHDAAASVQAGFAGEELTALWPAADWRLAEKPAALFSHCFVAERGSGADHAV
jgi:hypothetical protein